MFSFKQNPLEAASNEPISGAVGSLELRSNSGKISVSNLTEPIEVHYVFFQSIPINGSNMAFHSLCG